MSQSTPKKRAGQHDSRSTPPSKRRTSTAPDVDAAVMATNSRAPATPMRCSRPGPGTPFTAGSSRAQMTVKQELPAWRPDVKALDHILCANEILDDKYEMRDELAVHLAAATEERRTLPARHMQERLEKEEQLRKRQEKTLNDLQVRQEIELKEIDASIASLQEQLTKVENHIACLHSKLPGGNPDDPWTVDSDDDGDVGQPLDVASVANSSAAYASPGQENASLGSSAGEGEDEEASEDNSDRIEGTDGREDDEADEESADDNSDDDEGEDNDDDDEGSNYENDNGSH